MNMIHSTVRLLLDGLFKSLQVLLRVRRKSESKTGWHWSENIVSQKPKATKMEWSRILVR